MIQFPPSPVKPMLGLLLALFLIGAALEAQPPTNPAQASSPKAGPPKDRSATLVSNIWWNQEAKIAELGLSVEQRSKMDAKLKSFLQARQGSGSAQQEKLDLFGAALSSGDSAAAKKAADAVVEAMSSPIEQQTAMMISVLEELQPKQREVIASRYPRLLSRLWIRSANPRSGRIGRARRNP